MEILGARPVWSMSDSEKLSALDAVVAEEARLLTLRWQLTAGLDASGYAKELGAGDTARLLSARYRQDLKDARRDVRLANRIAAYTATGAALPDPAVPFPDPSYATAAFAETSEDGPAQTETAETAETAEAVDESATGRGAVEYEWRVSPAQAAAIVAVLDGVPSSVPLENLAVAEQELIGLAATHTPLELRRAGRRIRDLLDPDGPEPDEKEAYKRESLLLKPSDRGVTFTGYLANENAELFRTLIHTYARPHRTTDGELDPRPLSKRQADALTTILNATIVKTTGQSETSADASAGPGADGDAAGARIVPGCGPKPHISITIDYRDLSTATANATGSLIFGDELSAATVRRLACDADVLPIVLGSKSQPLDVGTSQRLVTRPMRRALNARDKGCVVCSAPPIHTEAHHIIHWADGGPTAVTNLALLCKRHHQDLHSGHWQIRILDGIVQVTRPPWTTPTRIPPDRYHPPTADIVHTPPAPPPDPWADEDHPTLNLSSPPPVAPSSTSVQAVVDPWGDEAGPAPGVSPVAPAARDVWGDAVPPAGVSAQGVVDPWGDEAGPAPGVSPVAPGARDMWGDAVSPAGVWARGVVGPWGDEGVPESA
ncbi:HNH endonuclease signature motif containing protein [Kribbella sp.]|uniref:HNH endonuclease signature motif containing protein n=1 Tax=Kribbella sp. TaxID=1871183 RepID=UPI002D6D4D91|nr:DUF222 domain-containing protein [Kribbella sp.]HZX04778.1 DUF222 domain-containing protein [Kribbella sp.]